MSEKHISTNVIDPVLIRNFDVKTPPRTIEEEFKKIYPAIMTKIRFELSPKPSKTEKEKQI